MTPIRVAVIGAGGIAGRHIANLAWFPGVRLVGVADPLIEAAEGQARRVAGTRAFADWREMLDKVPADALLICVPPFAHGEPELGAVERGLPFFVEKPIATDLPTAERIGRAVAESGLVTAVGYHWRYLDIVERAAELLAEKPAHLAMGYWWDATPPRDWWVRQATSGGQIVEQTTHIFDLARHLLGEARVVSTVVRHVPGRERAFPDADVADASVVSVVFDSGADRRVRQHAPAALGASRRPAPRERRDGPRAVGSRADGRRGPRPSCHAPTVAIRSSRSCATSSTRRPAARTGSGHRSPRRCERSV